MTSSSIVTVKKASKIVIPQKEGLVRAIQDEFNNKNSDAIEDLCIINTQRVPIMILTYTDRSVSCWELVNRILNVKIGRATTN